MHICIIFFYFLPYYMYYNSIFYEKKFLIMKKQFDNEPLITLSLGFQNAYFKLKIIIVDRKDDSLQIIFLNVLILSLV